jgi:hypothetical protein
MRIVEKFVFTAPSLFSGLKDEEFHRLGKYEEEEAK